MRLYHVTLRGNRPSIAARGIDPAFSRGARKECWYVTRGKLPWAVLHVMDRHKVPLGEVMVYEVLALRNRLTRRWRGVYTSPLILNPLFMTETFTGHEVAAERYREYPPEMMGGG